jgi:hypothetical protein
MTPTASVGGSDASTRCAACRANSMRGAPSMRSSMLPDLSKTTTSARPGARPPRRGRRSIGQRRVERVGVIERQQTARAAEHEQAAALVHVLRERAALREVEARPVHVVEQDGVEGRERRGRSWQLLRRRGLDLVAGRRHRRHARVRDAEQARLALHRHDGAGALVRDVGLLLRQLDRRAIDGEAALSGRHREGRTDRPR